MVTSNLNCKLLNVLLTITITITISPMIQNNVVVHPQNLMYNPSKLFAKICFEIKSECCLVKQGMVLRNINIIKVPVFNV